MSSDLAVTATSTRDGAAVDALFSRVKFEQVIHLAARAGVRPSLEQPALYQRVNVEGTGASTCI